MRPKYYLARFLGGSFQLSNEHFSSLKKAEKVRTAQVNPSQWTIVVNPLFVHYNSVNLKKEEEIQSQKLRLAAKLLHELTVK